MDVRRTALHRRRRRHSVHDVRVLLRPGVLIRNRRRGVLCGGKQQAEVNRWSW